MEWTTLRCQVLHFDIQLLAGNLTFSVQVLTLIVQQELPKGKWLCCADCKRINSALQKLVDHGEEKLPETSLNVLKKKNEDNTSDCMPDVDVRWRVLRGRNMDASDGTRVLLSKAVSIFHVSFFFWGLYVDNC